MAITSFEQLEVWQEAHALVLNIYRLTSVLTRDERYSLVPQMRRSAISVPANIAEGFKRRSLKDKCHFYNISQGSLEELRYYLLLCRDLGYEFDYGPLNAKANQVGKMLTGLIRSLQL